MLIIPQYKQINNKIVDNVDNKLEFDMAKAREAMISERSCARDPTGFSRLYTVRKTFVNYNERE
jgi:hypothetical protein